jgi:sortase A
MKNRILLPIFVIASFIFFTGTTLSRETTDNLQPDINFKKVNIANAPVPSPTPKPSPTISPFLIQNPKTLTIKKINVAAEIEHVGLDSQNRMDVPKNVKNVAWYKLGFKIGENGNAVIAGHLDTKSGAPAVFYKLNDLQNGDIVSVTDSSGKIANFRVTGKATFKYDQVPLEEVFGSSNRPKLNLMTCGGEWDEKSKNYSHRIVVYSELQE